MKLVNELPLPDRFLRRMISWLSREMGLPAGYVRQATFRTMPGRHFKGLAYPDSRKIELWVSLHPLDRYPFVHQRNRRAHPYLVWEPMDSLIHVTAHELSHQERWARLGTDIRNDEAKVDAVANMVLGHYNQDRAALLRDWAQGKIWLIPKKFLRSSLTRDDADDMVLTELNETINL